MLEMMKKDATETMKALGGMFTLTERLARLVGDKEVAHQVMKVIPRSTLSRMLDMVEQELADFSLFNMREESMGCSNIAALLTAHTESVKTMVSCHDHATRSTTLTESYASPGTVIGVVDRQFVERDGRVIDNTYKVRTRVSEASPNGGVAFMLSRNRKRTEDGMARARDLYKIVVY